jgi:hypothetical protein
MTTDSLSLKFILKVIRMHTGRRKLLITGKMVPTPEAAKFPSGKKIAKREITRINILNILRLKLLLRYRINDKLK